MWTPPFAVVQGYDIRRNRVYNKTLSLTAASAVSSKNDMRSYVLKWQRCIYLWLSVRSLPFGVVSAPLIG